MQAVTVAGRLVFVILLYLFLFRLMTALLADLQVKGWLRRAESEQGQLEVLAGGGLLPKGRVFRIDSKGLRIGRGKQNDIVVPDHFASIDHAVFRQQKKATLVEDMGSTNGTWVNGERIHSAVELIAGDYVKIGSITFQYSRWEDEGSKL